MRLRTNQRFLGFYVLQEMLNTYDIEVSNVLWYLQEFKCQVMLGIESIDCEDLGRGRVTIVGRKRDRIPSLHINCTV